MVSDYPEVLTVKAYAKITGANQNAVRKQCIDGTIPADKVGKKWYIPRDLVFRNTIKFEKEVTRTTEEKPQISQCA